jgi:hypothetical protein
MVISVLKLVSEHSDNTITQQRQRRTRQPLSHVKRSTLTLDSRRFSQDLL